MSKSKDFTPVRPEKARDGDLVLLPPNYRPSVGTLSKMGLSVGYTGRSDNSADTVSKFVTTAAPGKALVFLVADAAHARSSATQALVDLGMAAAPASATAPEPDVVNACLVPWGWDAEKGGWYAVWDLAHGRMLTRRLDELFGKELSVYDPGRKPGDPCRDEWANQVWDGSGTLCGSGVRAASHSWFPAASPYLNESRSQRGSANYVASLASWSSYDKSARLLATRRFLEVLGARGAAFVRPSAEFDGMVAESLVSWWCARMADRFAQRVAACRRYMRGLASDVRLDAGRARRLSGQSYRSGRGASALRKKMEELWLR